jgi:hypothetical protein
MNLTEHGESLVGELKTDLLEVLRSRPECQPGSAGLSNAAIERYAGLALHLDKQVMGDVPVFVAFPGMVGLEG